MSAGLLSTVTPPPKNEVYAVFAGDIDESAVKRIFNGIAAASGNRVDHIHLLMQSSGGTVGDGICLYNFFQTLNIDLTLYNGGRVASIAALAYLGAKERKTSAYATFMIHRTYTNAVGATSERLQSATESVSLDDKRTETIFRKRLTLNDEQWTTHRYSELWLSGDAAIACGLATSEGDFAPPAGQRFFVL